MISLMTKERQDFSLSWKKKLLDKTNTDKNAAISDPKQLAKLIAKKSIKDVIKNTEIPKIKDQ